jgi:hypothetical protein
MTRRYLFAFVTLGVFACEQVPTLVDTQIAFQLPVNDPEAVAKLSKLVIEAWPASLEVCAQFADWRQVVCNRDCPDDIDLARRVGHQPPKYQSQFEKGPMGWDFEPLKIGEQQNLQISIRGYDEEGIGMVYGCRSLALGERTVVSLARPWCDAKVCLERFHPACGAYLSIECGQQGSITSSVSSDPVCQTSTTGVNAWEEMGVVCAFVPVREDSRCRTARVKCEQDVVKWPDYLDSDGVCPIDGEVACKTDSVTVADDLNCDGILPVLGSGAMGCECEPGTSTTCKTTAENDCIAVATCNDEHNFGACASVPVMVDELCNGRDDNCNEIEDDQEPGAKADCQSLRIKGLPVASDCGRATFGPDLTMTGKASPIACVCGDSPACEKVDRACCDGPTGYSCVSSDMDEANCGVCGNACSNRDNCCDSSCFNTTTSTKHCGGCGLACRAGSACCNSGCKNIDTDESNCGVCGNACNGAEQCCGGACADLRGDFNNCGRCGNACSAVLADRCAGSACVCGDRRQDCSARAGSSCCLNAGGCVYLQTDVRNCGACGNVCDRNEACLNGMCLGPDTRPDSGVVAQDANIQTAPDGSTFARDSGR